MTGTGVLVIAGKEFFDHLMSRKFLLILTILLIVAVVGILNGIADYDTAVSAYNNQQKTALLDGGALSPADLTMKTKPSVLLVFFQMGLLFEMTGAVLGIALGFDLITREREGRSLKILLAHPVYRDQVINGKALGGVAAIALALGITLATSGAVMVLAGIVPEPSEFLPILIFSAATFLFIFGFFSIAILMSTLCEESGRSLVYTLIVFVILGAFIPALIASQPVVDQVVGPAPKMPATDTGAIQKAMESGNTPEAERLQKANAVAWETYNQQSLAYAEKQMKWLDLEFLFSPVHNYEKISIFLTNPKARSDMINPISGFGGGVNSEDPEMSVSVMIRKISDLDLPGVLAMISGNIAALLILPAVFFGLAYICFMRMDIR